MTKKLKEGGLGDLAHAAERDHEVQMARADLYKVAKYAIKLHDMLKTVSEAEGIDGWKQSKITKAADYIGSVYHAMDYDMKFSESKQAKNVLKRSKTMTEESYLESMQAKVAKKVSESTDVCSECGNPSYTTLGLSEDELSEVAGPEKCWKGYKRAGTQKGTGKNAGKRVNKCVKA
tara:strand:- start:1 stop:528 length:528 start_codon:yes stop_codon:yes gene_type:complete